MPVSLAMMVALCWNSVWHVSWSNPSDPIMISPSLDSTTIATPMTSMSLMMFARFLSFRPASFLLFCFLAILWDLHSTYSKVAVNSSPLLLPTNKAVPGFLTSVILILFWITTSILSLACLCKIPLMVFPLSEQYTLIVSPSLI